MFDICSIPVYTASLHIITHGTNHSAHKSQMLARNCLIHITGAYTTNAHKAVGGCRMTSAHRPLRIKNLPLENCCREPSPGVARQKCQADKPARLPSQLSSEPTKFGARQAPRQLSSEPASLYLRTKLHAATQNPPDPLRRHPPHRDPLHPDLQRPYRRRYPHLRHPHRHPHQHQPQPRHRHRAHQARRRDADR